MSSNNLTVRKQQFLLFPYSSRKLSVINNLASIGVHCVASGGMGSPHVGSQTRRSDDQLEMSWPRLLARGNYSSALLAGGVEPGFNSKTMTTLRGFLKIEQRPRFSNTGGAKYILWKSFLKEASSVFLKW